MKWKQFFTPVKSMNADQVRTFLKDRTSEDVVILDVRQPKEYKQGHLPGAKLIPMGELDTRLSEIETEKEKLVYCAIGGRSRMAVQMLSGKGFTKLINFSGGYKAWNGEAAYGLPDQGLELFSGNESLETVLAVAYSLEDGLRDFYIEMAGQVENESAKTLFMKLSEIEIKHQDRIYREYAKIADQLQSREEFVLSKISNTVEGGLSTQEYIRAFNANLNSPVEVTELAMSIEAQALDLYFRASENIQDKECKGALTTLADEERAHLKALSELMDKLF